MTHSIALMSTTHSGGGFGSQHDRFELMWGHKIHKSGLLICFIWSPKCKSQKGSNILLGKVWFSYEILRENDVDFGWLVGQFWEAIWSGNSVGFGEEVAS